MSKALPIVDGRRFGCTACGNCCMEPGYVYMTGEEVERIATHLALSERAFKAKFRVQYERASKEWFIDALDGKGCPLLDADRKCSVHPVKPRQCSTFPFWDELLDDAARWEASKSFCPGLDAPKGELYDRGRILAIRAGWLGT
ncbi:YkgJ family cysteine cluster protein [Myxococcota bacterium]|nr:YkgJ family cysteine cluster protein [Myxococcota bacterium]